MNTVIIDINVVSKLKRKKNGIGITYLNIIFEITSD
jgi:hypothetical protein